MQNFTDKHRAALEEYLASHILPKGLGAKESACSLEAINLAMTGELTDKIPDCMSLVLGRATIRLQDAMPGEMRNSKRYKSLLPHMAGTGREREQERCQVLVNWLWGGVLPQLQRLAEKHGFGDKWQTMCSENKSVSAAAAAYADAYAADAARAAAYAAADAARAAAYAAAARAAAYAAADAARAAAKYDGRKTFWEEVDVIGVLERATFLDKE